MSRVLSDESAKLIPLDLLDEPDEAARETLDERALLELMGSIADLGQIQAGVVSPRGERFVIRAGHRRFLACRALELPYYRANVIPAEAEVGEAIKVAENEHREPVNPAEQAIYFSRILEKYCGGDVDRLCAYVRQKESYVQSRLVLLKGDPHVLEALRRKDINLGVAQELNLFKHDALRRSYLASAIEGGATRAIVARWRIDADAAAKYIPEMAPPVAGADGAEAAPSTFAPHCEVCGETHPVYQLRILYVHEGVCMKLFTGALKPFKDAQEQA